MALTAKQLTAVNWVLKYLEPASCKPQIIDQNIADQLLPLSTVLNVNQTVFLELLRDRPTHTLLRIVKAVGA